MGRLIINAVLLLIVQEIYFVATATDQETCESDRLMEEQCRIHNYKTVKPLLDYFRQVRNELEDKEIKENKLNELNSDLLEKYQEIVRIHEKFVKEAALLDEYKNKVIKGENDLQLCKNRVDKFESETNSQQNVIVKLKGELAEKSTNLENCEIQYKTLNSSLFEKDENIKRFSENIQNITEHQKTIELQLEQSKTKLIKKDKDNQLCRAEIDTLNKTLINTLIPSSCSHFGDYPGVHEIRVSGIGSVDVLCDSQLAGPGWIVIQQRVGGNESFNRDWATYRKGFGEMDSDFFLGLEKIHRITSLQRFELYIHLVALNGSTYNARYDDFKISDEDSGFKLSLGKFSGTIVEDAMRDGEDEKFTTFDRDNDEDLSTNCANYFNSGWWYHNCYNCNLNALYGPDLNWYRRNPLKEAKMLIRPKKAIHEKIMKEVVQFDEYKSKIQKGENDLQLCQNRVDKLESENNSQKNIIDNLGPISKLFENYDKCKEELTSQSNKLLLYEIELKKLNSSLLEKDTHISEYTAKFQNVMEHQEKIQLQLEESQSKLQKQDKNNEICNAEVDKLVRFVNASSCIPFADYPGIHKIQVSGVDFFDVLCDSQLAGPGWIVIQQRVGGKERFNRDWATYREGFGSMDSDFFLGLEKIYRLTNSRRHELYVHLVELNGTIYYARYDDFKISDENNGYALSLGGFMGNVSDAMRISENLKFITFDRGDDKRCADHYKSGWWYKSCYNCNLNAVYGTNFNWYLDVKIELKEAKMLMRPKE